MSCPSWEDCNKKFCIVNYRCCLVEADPCSKIEGICDKDAACKFLRQCIFTIKAVKGNSKLIKALSGRHNTIGQVLAILKEHNPKPMRSYYIQQVKKKKK